MTTETKAIVKNEAGTVTVHEAPKAPKQVRLGETVGQIFLTADEKDFIHKNRPQHGQDSTYGKMSTALLNITIPNRNAKVTTAVKELIGTPMGEWLNPQTPHKIPVKCKILLLHIGIRAGQFIERNAETICLFTAEEIYRIFEPTTTVNYRDLPTGDKKEVRRDRNNILYNLRNASLVPDPEVECGNIPVILGGGYIQGQDRFIVKMYKDFATIIKQTGTIFYISDLLGLLTNKQEVECEIILWLSRHAARNVRLGVPVHSVYMETLLDDVVDIIHYEELRDTGNRRRDTHLICGRTIKALNILKKKKLLVWYKLLLDGKEISPAEAQKKKYSTFSKILLEYKLRADLPSQDVLRERAAKKAKRIGAGGTTTRKVQKTEKVKTIAPTFETGKVLIKGPRPPEPETETATTIAVNTNK